MRRVERVLALASCLMIFGCGSDGTSGSNNDDQGAEKWCVDVQCGDHGECQVDGSRGVCVCDTGYAGITCDVCVDGYQDNDGDGVCAPSCSGDVACGEHGSCLDELGVVLCECEAGYEGKSCDTCAEGYQDNDGDGVCEPDCVTSALDCGEHGYCVDTSGAASCACDQGFEGEYCDNCVEGTQDRDGDGICRPTCAESELECGALGLCDDSSGVAECVCNTGYAGADCDECAEGYQDNDGDGVCAPDCDTRGLTCNNHGTCSDELGVALCECEAEYTGADCDECASGYQDDDGDGVCEPSCTSSVTCSGHGSCLPVGSSELCMCDVEYTGANCDECASGYQDNDNDGVCAQTCDSVMCASIEVCDDSSGAAECVFAGPVSCADVVSAAGGASLVDGYYTLYVNQDETKPWDAYCVGMGSPTPQEYLTLAYTDDEYSVFESYGVDGPVAQTRYFRVRVDPVSLMVDVTDRAFSETLDFVDSVASQEDVDYGTAKSCSRNNSDQGAYVAATGRIDLRNTPFAVNDTFAGYGVCPDVSAMESEQGQVISLSGDGACGTVAPDDVVSYEGAICPLTGTTIVPDATSPRDFALQLEYAGGYQSLELVPSTCAEIKAFGLGAVDGDYTLYYARDTAKPWTAYCYEMASDDPKEYLSLNQAGNANRFKRGTFGGSGTSQSNTTRKFQRIRVNPLTLKVDITDRTFSTGTALLDFATADSCSDNCCGGNNPGEANIDLTGTPFFVDDTFARSGYCSSLKSISYSNSDQVVVFTADGQCGFAGPSQLANKSQDGCNNKPDIQWNSETKYLLQLGYL